jgi:hypothetical protein
LETGESSAEFDATIESVTQIPEPTTLPVAGGVLLALQIAGWRRRRTSPPLLASRPRHASSTPPQPDEARR